MNCHMSRFVSVSFLFFWCCVFTTSVAEFIVNGISREYSANSAGILSCGYWAPEEEIRAVKWLKGSSLEGGEVIVSMETNSFHSQPSYGTNYQGERILFTYPSNFESPSGDINLVFSRVDPSDAATYWCVFEYLLTGTQRQVAYQEITLTVVESVIGYSYHSVWNPTKLGMDQILYCNFADYEAYQVYWSVGSYHDTAELIISATASRPTVKIKYGTSPVAERCHFFSGNSEIFTQRDATLLLERVGQDDMDQYWCWIETSFDPRTSKKRLIAKVELVADTSPLDPIGTEEKGDWRLLPKQLYHSLLHPSDNPQLFAILVSSLAGLLTCLLLTFLICRCCLCPPTSSKDGSHIPLDRRSRQTETYPNRTRQQNLPAMASRISHISIVPCEICKENAIEWFAMPCGHTYCEECLDALIESRGICAFCRMAIERKQKLYHHLEESQEL